MAKDKAVFGSPYESGLYVVFSCVNWERRRPGVPKGNDGGVVRGSREIGGWGEYVHY